MNRVNREIEERLARALVADAIHALEAGHEVSPYFFHHLAEHAGAGESWELLTYRAEILDHISPRTVAAEAFRSGYGFRQLPPGVLASMIVPDELETAEVEQRRLIRGCRASRLWSRSLKH